MDPEQYRVHFAVWNHDLLMLLDLERRRGYGTATRHRVANDLGINERTVRRRRDRAIAALRQAAPTYLASVA